MKNGIVQPVASCPNLYSLAYRQTKTYLFALAFVAGNVLLPQLFHLVPQGGLRWLPIYFFTLVGAYKYGWRVGLLTAVASPLINSAFFGMPPVPALPAILLKSVLLALSASYVAHSFRKAALWQLLLVVLSYQLLGTFGEWAWTQSLSAALQDFRIGIPGMLFQIFGGYVVINYIIRR